MIAQQALEILLQGNERFASGNALHPGQTPACRVRASTVNRPLAAILTCVDPRTVPEFIFDVGLGDLLVIRVPGAMVSDEVLGAIEGSITLVGTRLIVVMGHSSCLAIKSVMQARLEDQLETPQETLQYEKSFRSTLEKLRPVVEQFVGAPPEMLDEAIKTFTRHVAAHLCEVGPILKARSALGDILVVPAFYDLRSGRVDLL